MLFDQQKAKRLVSALRIWHCLWAALTVPNNTSVANECRSSLPDQSSSFLLNSLCVAKVLRSLLSSDFGSRDFKLDMAEHRHSLAFSWGDFLRKNVSISWYQSILSRPAKMKGSFQVQREWVWLSIYLAIFMQWTYLISWPVLLPEPQAAHVQRKRHSQKHEVSNADDGKRGRIDAMLANSLGKETNTSSGSGCIIYNKFELSKWYQPLFPRVRLQECMVSFTQTRLRTHGLGMLVNIWMV